MESALFYITTTKKCQICADLIDLNPRPARVWDENSPLNNISKPWLGWAIFPANVAEVLLCDTVKRLCWAVPFIFLADYSAFCNHATQWPTELLELIKLTLEKLLIGQPWVTGIELGGHIKNINPKNITPQLSKIKSESSRFWLIQGVSFCLIAATAVLVVLINQLINPLTATVVADAITIVISCCLSIALSFYFDSNYDFFAWKNNEFSTSLSRWPKWVSDAVVTR